MTINRPSSNPQAGRSNRPGGALSLSESAPVMQETRTARLLDWVFAPVWLTLEQACFLSGWDQDSMLEIINDGGVD